MERNTTIEAAENIFGKNFIGPEDIRATAVRMGVVISETIPPVPFEQEFLKSRAQDYLLVFAGVKATDGQPVTIAYLRSIFGLDPSASEPCFYNQDWYLKEKFITTNLEKDWLLIRKVVFNDSRAVDPDELVGRCQLPSAVECVYVFFACWLSRSEILWENDFVWCGDLDANGDRIYVGRYKDMRGSNKNGFNIHRHLKIKNNYGCVDMK